MQTYKDFTDDVSGQVIGDFLSQAFVTYEGRKQGPTLYVRNDEEAKHKAQIYIDELRADCGEAFRMIYPNKSWSIKFI